MAGFGALTPEQKMIAMQGMTALTTGAAFAFASQAKLKYDKFPVLEPSRLYDFLDGFQEKPRLLISVTQVGPNFLAIYYEQE